MAFGPLGSGKMHALAAVEAQELVRAGRRVLFTTCSLLVQDLLVAWKATSTLKGLLETAVPRWEVDSAGRPWLRAAEPRGDGENLFTLAGGCYERGSVLLTSNLPFSKWEQIFKDPMTAAAVIDRLVHHSVIMERNVSSHRAEAAKAAAGPGGAGHAAVAVGVSRPDNEGAGGWGPASPRSPALRCPAPSAPPGPHPARFCTNRRGRLIVADGEG